MDDLSIGALHVPRRRSRDRPRFCLDRRGRQWALLQAEIVEDQKPEQAEPSGRPREAEEIASRFEGQQAVGRVLLGGVGIRHDGYEIPEDWCGRRRIFRHGVEVAATVLVPERRWELAESTGG